MRVMPTTSQPQTPEIVTSLPADDDPALAAAMIALADQMLADENEGLGDQPCVECAWENLTTSGDLTALRLMDACICDPDPLADCTPGCPVC